MNIAKEVCRNVYKGRAKLAIFVGFEENTLPGFKFYRSLYSDFIMTAHCKFRKFIRGRILASLLTHKWLKPNRVLLMTLDV